MTKQTTRPVPVIHSSRDSGLTDAMRRDVENMKAQIRAQQEAAKKGGKR